MSDYTSTGTPVVMPTNISDLRIDPTGIARVSVEHVERLARHSLKSGDIVYSRRGDVEKCALIRDEEVGWLCGTGCLLVRVGGEQVDARFLCYSLSQPETRAWITGRAVGATMPNLNTGILREVPVLLPPIDEQRGIAATLGAIDDKIESNCRAQNLVLDTAEAAYVEACFKGSQLTALKDVGRWLSGGTPSTTNSNYWGGTLPWVSAASLKSLYIRKSDRNLTLIGADAATNIVPAGTVIFVVRGMSLKSEFRFGLTQREVTFGQDCKAIIPRICPAVLTIALRARTAAILELVDEAGHGTGRLATDLLEQLPIEIPTDPAFASVAQSFLARGASAAEENDRLIALRDTLLPELLSGRIRVPECKDDAA